MKHIASVLLILTSQMSLANHQASDEKYAAWVMMRLKSIVEEKMYGDQGQPPRSEADLFKFCNSSHIDILHQEFAELKRLPVSEVNSIQSVNDPGDGWGLPAGVGYCASTMDACLGEKAQRCENFAEIIEKNRVTPKQAGYSGGSTEGGIPALCKKFMQAMANSIKQANTDFAKCPTDEVAQTTPPASDISPLPVNLHRSPSGNKAAGAAAPR